MFQNLRITGLFLLFCDVLPFLTQNDSPLQVLLHIPCAENHHLLIMVDERPAPHPVSAGCAAAQDKLFSIQISPHKRLSTSVSGE